MLAQWPAHAVLQRRTADRAAVKVTAHLGRTFNGRTVRIYAATFGTRTAVLIKVGRVDSRGDLTVSYRPARSTTFIARFAGDAKYQPAAASRRVYVRAGVTQRISGYYGSERIGRCTGCTTAPAR